MATHTGTPTFTLSNDEPTLRDRIGRAAMVREVGRAVLSCSPPQVFGVHGEWGCGKTSFLHQLQLYLTGECPQNVAGANCATETQRLRDNDADPADSVTVVWFEAWRYQNEAVPIVALLQEIRTQISWQLRMLTEGRKLMSVAIRGALLSLEDLTKKIGIQASKIQSAGERWERDHLAYALPAHTIRDHLNDALGKLLKKGEDDEATGRLVVLVDDLDRCEAEAAFSFLEGIKIYLNLPNCVFVLGMNQEIVVRAIRRKFKDEPDASHIAREYLEKLCQCIYQLPRSWEPQSLLESLLTVAGLRTGLIGPVAGVVSESRCLPLNPRKVKRYANTILRFAACCDRQGPVEDLDVRVLVIMASLYLFHPELYRLLEVHPDFYNKMQLWAQGEPFRHDLLDKLVLPMSPVQSDAGSKDAVPHSELERAFADPVDDRVFRIQDLVAQTNPSVSLIRRFLLR